VVDNIISETELVPTRAANEDEARPFA
jgi:hypothetical protein